MFIQWVKASNYLQENRIVPKGKLSRLQFIRIVEQWIFKNFRKIKDEHKIYQPSNKLSFLEQKQLFPLFQQFMQQFEYFPYFQNKPFSQQDYFWVNLSKNKDIEYLNQMMKQKTPKWSFFMLKLLQSYYNRRNSPILCKKIYTAFKNSISDKLLLEEFSIEFKINVSFQVFTTQSFEISYKFLQSILDYLSKINSSDLILFYRIIKNLLNKLLVKSTYGTKLSQFLKGKKIIFCRFIESLTDYFQSQLYGNENHFCLSPASLHNLIMMSKYLNFKELEISEIFKETKSKEIKCQMCKGILQASLSLNNLGTMLTSYIQEKNSLNKLNSQITLNQLFIESQKLINLFQQHPFLKPHWQQIVSPALRYCQLACYLNDQNQDKYHGLENYYNFTSKHNKIHWFLQTQYQNSFPIQKTLIVLKRKGEGKHIQFMFKLTEYLGKSLLYKDYLIIVLYCKNFFSLLSEEELLTLFQDLKMQSVLYPNNSYFAIIFQIFLSVTLNTHLQRAAVSIIMKMFPKLLYRFQRALSVQQYFFALKPLTDQKKNQKINRQWQFYNNKLVKQFNISGHSIPQKTYHKNKSKKDFLISKIRKIEKVQGGIQFKMQ